MFRTASALLLVLLLAVPATLAQGTGKISGRVTDVAGDPLPGANIVLVGTTLGAAADVNGNYNILGVPVGQYDVTATFIGYQTITIQRVEINAGYTRILDFQLREGQELSEIVVEYERPIIQNDAIGATRVVSAQELENLTVRGVTNVAAIQGGVVSEDNSGTLNIRGGRGEEVVYFVDGVRVTGNALIGVNQASVQEQEMLIGTIPARFGDVQSGVISITTKSGGRNFFGSVEAVTSEVLDSYGYNLFSGSLGGPLVPGKASFFLSAEGNFVADNNPYAIDSYRLPDDDFAFLQDNPQVVTISDGTETRFVPFPSGEVAALIAAGDTLVSTADLAALLNLPAGFSISDPGLINAPETYRADRFERVRGKDDPLLNITLNGNVSFDITDETSLRVGGGFVSRDREVYQFFNSLYNRDRFNHDEQQTWRLFGTLRQRLSDATFFQLQGEFQSFKRYFYPNGFSRDVADVGGYAAIDEPFNEVWRNYYQFRNGEYERAFTQDGVTPLSAVGGPTFNVSGVPLVTYQKLDEQTLRFTASATTQLGVHQLEFGGEFQQDTQRRFQINGRRFAAAVNDTVAYADVSPAVFRDGSGAWAFGTGGYYGYNYNGTREVNDEDLEAYFANERLIGTDQVDVNALNIAPYRPLYYAGYIQDKIEYRDLVINLGVRIDVFDNNTSVLRDLYAARPVTRVRDLAPADQVAGMGSDYAVYYNSDFEIVGFRDLDGNFFDEAGSATTSAEVVNVEGGTMCNKLLSSQRCFDANASMAEVFEDYKPQVTLMPRVGVSFPVTEQTLFFASYNVTTQRPTERAFGPFRQYDDVSNNWQSNFFTPNPNLQPERTTQYEIGIRQRLGDRSAVTLAGFLRNQDNKIAARVLAGSLAPSTFVNEDFTTSKGAELGFELRRTNGVQVNANYTLAFAQGTGSSAIATTTAAWRGSLIPNFLTPADFDQRHTANITVDYRLGDNEGPQVGSTYLLENFGMNLLSSFGSGQRFTQITAPPGEVGISTPGTVEGDINGGTLPATLRLDLRVDRSFTVGRGGATLKPYLLIQNLLDARNVQAVYRATGLADEDGYLATQDGLAYLDGAFDRDAAEFHYRAYTGGPVATDQEGGVLVYGLPRQVRLGVLFNF